MTGLKIMSSALISRKKHDQAVTIKPLGCKEWKLVKEIVWLQQFVRMIWIT